MKLDYTVGGPREPAIVWYSPGSKQRKSVRLASVAGLTLGWTPVLDHSWSACNIVPSSKVLQVGHSKGLFDGVPEWRFFSLQLAAPDGGHEVGAAVLLQSNRLEVTRGEARTFSVES